MLKRKYDRSHAAMILRVPQYFEQELREGKRRKLHDILEQTVAVTGVSRATISRIRRKDDVHCSTIAGYRPTGVRSGTDW